MDARPDTNPKSAFGMTKPSLSLIPPVAMIEEAVVFGLGAKKYGPYNWRETSVSARVYIDAAFRHIQAWQDGQDIDPVEEGGSGASHLAHARACLGIILDAKEVGKLIDDRPLPGGAAAAIKRHTKQPPPAPDTAIYDEGGSIIAAKDAGVVAVGDTVTFGDGPTHRIEDAVTVPDHFRTYLWSLPEHLMTPQVSIFLSHPEGPNVLVWEDWAGWARDRGYRTDDRSHARSLWTDFENWKRATLTN